MIVETLVAQLGIAVIDTTVESVQISTGPALQHDWLMNANFLKDFTPGDNISILSMGVNTIPGAVIFENDILAPGEKTFSRVSWFINVTGATPNAGAISEQIMPFMPYELSIGNFIPIQSSTSWYMRSSFNSTNPRLCCVNVNPIFQGKTVTVDCFVKIAHTLEMV